MVVIRGYILCVALIAVVLMITSKTASGEFILTVSFINYTNPTGLCAECETELGDVTSADQLVPVCCDDQPFTNTSCDNTGEGRCDTRFRWTIRAFGASLETRPVSIPNAANPPYFFTNCLMSPSTCPFSEMSTTFGQGLTAILGVTENPLPVSKTDFLSWTGRVQFFIEAIDSRLPNIIDSLLIDLDTLQLGADFTEEMTFTGFHNISHMTMSFRVECSPSFCGPDCMTTPQNNPQVATCRTDGSLTCTNNRLDPSPLVACKDCLYNLDNTTDCSTCLDDNYDPTTNCTLCLLEFYDLQTNCTQCLPKRNLSTNCTTCLSGSNCKLGSSLNVGLVGGIAGGVGGALFLVVIVLVIVVCLLVCQVRRRGHVKFVSAHHAYDNAGTGTGSSAEHKFQNPIYGPGLEMDLKTGTGSSNDHAFTNSLYETSNVHTKDGDSQPSVSPPSHTVKTGTQDLTSTLDRPMYDTASCLDIILPREGTPVYDTADHTRQPPFTNPQDEDYSKLRQPPGTNITPQPTSSLGDYDTATFIDQPVYDEAFPPPDDSLAKKGTRHTSKSAGAYEDIEDEDIRGRDEYDTTYPPPAVIPSGNVYSKLGRLEAELPAYDVANNHHSKQVQPKAPPPNGSLYDTADYPQEQATRPEHDYTETSDFLSTLIKKETSQRTYDYADANEFLSGSSSAKHSYDYVDNPIDDTNALPPALAPLASSVYTNTKPGKITLEAESHYDLGQ